MFIQGNAPISKTNHHQALSLVELKCRTSGKHLARFGVFVVQGPAAAAVLCVKREMLGVVK